MKTNLNARVSINNLITASEVARADATEGNENRDFTFTAGVRIL